MKRLLICLAVIVHCTPLAAAQSLACKVIPGSTREPWGNGGSPSTAQDTASISDEDWSLGYRATGGGCDPSPVHFGEKYGSVVNIPGERSFTCKHFVTEAPPGQAANGAAVRAYLYACRNVTDPVDSRQPSLVAASNVFALVRRGHSIAKRFRFDYRVCNSDVKGMLNVTYTAVPKIGEAAKQPSLEARPIGPGRCVELGGRSFVSVQSGTGETNVFYQRFPLGTFPAVDPPKETPASENPGVVLEPGRPAPGEPPKVRADVPVSCKAFPRPSKLRDESTFSYYCKLPLKSWGHYRVCFGKDYVERRDGSRTDWPYKLMLVAINEKPVSRPGGATDGTSPRLNATNSQTCRDYYDVNDAHLLVGGEQVPWLPNDIKYVHMSIEEISGR